MIRRFSQTTLAGFAATKYLRIRAGEHRFIHIWVVVVDGRVVVRSWNDNLAAGIALFLRKSTAQCSSTVRKYQFAPLAFAAYA